MRKTAVVGSAAVMLLLAMISCGGGGGASAVMNHMPDGDYFLLMGFDTTKLLSSSAFEKMMEMLSEAGQGPEDYFEKMSEQWEGSSVDWTELNTALMILSYNPRETITFLRSDGMEIEKVVDFIEDTWGGEVEEEEEGGIKYWWDESSKSGLMEIEGGMLMAADEAIENTIGVKTEGKKRLLDDEDFRDALTLTDLNSTMYIAAWGGLEEHTRGITKAFKMIESDDEVIERFDAAMGDLEAVGVAIWFDDGFAISAGALFADGDTAVFAESFLREKLEQLEERVADRREFLKYIAPRIDPSLPEEMLSRITISRSGNAVAARIDIDDIDPVIELAMAGYEANNKYKVTHYAIETIARGVEAYGFDHGFYPEADGIDELLAILTEDSFYLPEGTAGVDGWGFPLIYEYGPSETRGHNYSVMSYGADGKPGPETAPDESGLQDVTRYVEDYVYSNGFWVKKPKY